MTRPHTSRRTVIKGIGAAIATATGSAAVGAASTDEWTAVKSPTDSSLYDVADTNEGAYAVGTGGVVLSRTAAGWRKLLDGGPTGNGNDLYGADVTDDGKRLWFVGASGAIGEYDVESGVLTDRSAPNDVTNNFNDVAVTGTADEADVYVAGDSGSIYYSVENGAPGTWDYVTPGSGSNINAIDFHGDGSGHAVDGNQTVFATDDGVTWDKLGIEDANFNFYGLVSNAPDDVWVSGGGGSIYRWNGSEWRRADTGDADLRSIVVDGTGLSVGSGGTLVENDGAGWESVTTPTGANLRGVLQGTRDVAVGASGTILER